MGMSDSRGWCSTRATHDGSDADARRQRLAQLRGPVAANDAETMHFWQQQSPSRHADAMIELSEYAEAMARQTGHHKAADDMFPGLPSRGEG